MLQVKGKPDSKTKKIYYKRLWCTPTGRWLDTKPAIAMFLGLKHPNNLSKSSRRPASNTGYAQHPPATAAQRPAATAAHQNPLATAAKHPAATTAQDKPSATEAQKQAAEQEPGAGDICDSEAMNEAMNMLDQVGSSKVQIRMLEGGMAQLLRERPDRIMKRWQLSDGTLVLLQEVGAVNRGNS